VLAGLGLSLVGTTATAIGLLLGAPPPVVAACITLSMAPLGLNGPNLVGLALNQVTKATGSAAATIGFVQFCTGALVSPLVGLGGDDTAVPMLIGMSSLAIASIVVLLVRGRPSGFKLAARLGGS
jgi:DHA1 family bicyclomycin/chloramphenicol resistance-like MFS transporter